MRLPFFYEKSRILNENTALFRGCVQLSIKACNFAEHQIDVIQSIGLAVVHI